MSKSKLPPAKNWRERNIEDWNAHTFQAYMAERHQELFGIDYTTNNYGMENSHLKAFFTKYDCATLKRFIDACFADYTPRPGWPSSAGASSGRPSGGGRRRSSPPGRAPA